MSGEPPVGPDRGRKAGLVLGAWLLLGVVSTLPYLQAQQYPPSGGSFTGALFYPDDFYQYASFAEQATRGAFLFSNKFDPEPHGPAFVNLEWWAAGRLGAIVDGWPLVGFPVLRIAAIGALLLAIARLLGAAGLEGAHLGWGMALVATGGGLGWLRYFQGAQGWRIPDVLMGLYPWHQTLSNVHFVVGTALLLWTIHLHLLWRQGRAPRWAWLAVAWILGLSRPYDLAALGPVVIGLAAWDAVETRQWKPAVRAASDLVWLAPLFAYYAFMVGGHPSFGGWGAQSGDLSPPRREFLMALGPAAVLILAGRRIGPATREATDVRRALILWCGALTTLLLVWTAPMAKQCLGLGAALLLWAAVVTPARRLAVAVFALSPTSAVVLWLAFHPGPSSFVPADSLAVTTMLHRACAPGQVTIAPTDLSLAVAALTPCHVALGHRLLTPRFKEAVVEGNRFYDAATPLEWRLMYLDRSNAEFVALPAGHGDWLGPSPPFERILARPSLELWQRSRPAFALAWKPETRGAHLP